MGAWEDERPVYEDEDKLLPQQKEEMVQEANKRRERDYERGKRAVKGMLILYSVRQALSLIVSLGQGDLLAWLLSLVLAVTLVYNIWHGRRWARNCFAVLLGLTIVLTLQGISKLNITRTDYNSQRNSSGDATIYISGLDEAKTMEDISVKTIGEMNPEEIASLQESEDIRVKYHRVVLAVSLFDLAVCAGYLYILFGYQPAKEFLYGQSSV